MMQNMLLQISLTVFLSTNNIKITIIVIMQKEDTEESTYPVYGKEYTFSKISDGYDVSG